MNSAIKVKNLSKKYSITHKEQSNGYQTIGDSIQNTSQFLTAKIKHPFSKLPKKNITEDFWALKNLNFEISRGDIVGIIGKNGAGKSTLLKVLSRISEPSTGKICINGRIASLLEVGTGFHPELTGKENIYLNGAILGMTRLEVKQKLDEIIAFAEIEKFLDTPVKRYSSGMYVRLAFAVAAHLNPEILIVDEVLAVGDMKFQQKCLGKFKEISGQGRTVLFVSHNISSIQSLCNKGIELENGQIRSIGLINKVIESYMNTENTSSHYIKPTNLEVDDKALINELYLTDKNNNKISNIFVNDEFTIHIKWQLNIDVPFLRVRFEFKNSLGITTFTTIDTDKTNLHGKKRSQGSYYQYVTIPSFLLIPDIYSISVFVGIPKIERLIEKIDLIKFEILENNSHLSLITNDKRQGYIATPLQWQLKHNS